MESSLEVWPTSSNPASFIPIYIDYSPFESLASLPIFQRSDAVECPGCKRFIDSHFTRESDRFKCCYCQKLFKSDSITAGTQFGFDSFRLRGPDHPLPWHYNLIFALDACAGQSQIDHLRHNLITAIRSLRNDRPFHLAIIQPNYITYVIVLDQIVVRFDIPHGPGLSSQMNLRWDGNYSCVLPMLEPYINSIRGHDDPHSVADLIVQLKGDDALFSRIVLFSPRAPQKPEKRNIFVDWIHPDTVLDIKDPLIDGYFLSMSSSASDIDTQIQRLMELISGNTVFNLELNPCVIGYKWKSDSLLHATATAHFRQSFQLTPVKLNPLGSGSGVAPLFAIEAKYICFHEQTVCEETIWMSRAFRKSNDFIPVCASLNPLVMVPRLSEDDKLEQFVVDLMKGYHQYCLSVIAGGALDLTFSAFPNLQWLLLALWGVPAQLKRASSPFYGDCLSRFAHSYPRLSYWTGVDCCIAERAHIAYDFFVLLGEPQVAVMDSFYEIDVFGIGGAEDGSALAKFLEESAEKRFPQPIIEFRPKEQLLKMLRSNQGLLERIERELGSKIDLGALSSGSARQSSEGANSH